MIETNSFSEGLRIGHSVNHALHGCGNRAKFIRLKLFLLVFMTVLLGLAPQSMRGQELSATLSGSVTDVSGAVIPHATITIALNGVNGTARSVVSDGAGNYSAPNLTGWNVFHHCGGRRL